VPLNPLYAREDFYIRYWGVPNMNAFYLIKNKSKALFSYILTYKIYNNYI